VDFNKHRNIIRIKIPINSVKVGSRLNNSSDASQNDSFVFSAAQYKFTTTTDGKDVITRVAPGMRLDLNASYFKTKIIEASALGKLSVMMFLKNTLEGCILKLRSQEVVLQLWLY
jgi:hypothetical protein